MPPLRRLSDPELLAKNSNLQQIHQPISSSSSSSSTPKKPSLIQEYESLNAKMTPAENLNELRSLVVKGRLRKSIYEEIHRDLTSTPLNNNNNNNKSPKSNNSNNSSSSLNSTNSSSPPHTPTSRIIQSNGGQSISSSSSSTSSKILTNATNLAIAASKTIASATKKNKTKPRRKTRGLKYHEKPLISGYLFVRTHILGNVNRILWVKRFVVMYHSRFEFYKSQNIFNKSKNIINNNNNNKHILSTHWFNENYYVSPSTLVNLGNNKTNGFVVSDYETNYYFAAEFEDLKDYWIHTISNALRYLLDLSQIEDYPVFLGKPLHKSESTRGREFEQRVKSYQNSLEKEKQKNNNNNTTTTTKDTTTKREEPPKQVNKKPPPKTPFLEINVDEISTSSSPPEKIATPRFIDTNTSIALLPSNLSETKDVKKELAAKVTKLKEFDLEEKGQLIPPPSPSSSSSSSSSTTTRKKKKTIVKSEREEAIARIIAAKKKAKEVKQQQNKADERKSSIALENEVIDTNLDQEILEVHSRSIFNKAIADAEITSLETQLIEARNYVDIALATQEKIRISLAASNSVEQKLTVAEANALAGAKTASEEATELAREEMSLREMINKARMDVDEARNQYDEIRLQHGLEIDDAIDNVMDDEDFPDESQILNQHLEEEEENERKNSSSLVSSLPSSPASSLPNPPKNNSQQQRRSLIESIMNDDYSMSEMSSLISSTASSSEYHQQENAKTNFIRFEDESDYDDYYSVADSSIASIVTDDLSQITGVNEFSKTLLLTGSAYDQARNNKNNKKNTLPKTRKSSNASSTILSDVKSVKSAKK